MSLAALVASRNTADFFGEELTEFTECSRFGVMHRAPKIIWEQQFQNNHSVALRRPSRSAHSASSVSSAPKKISDRTTGAARLQDAPSVRSVRSFPKKISVDSRRADASNPRPLRPPRPITPTRLAVHKKCAALLLACRALGGLGDLPTRRTASASDAPAGSGS